MLTLFREAFSVYIRQPSITEFITYFGEAVLSIKIAPLFRDTVFLITNKNIAFKASFPMAPPLYGE